MIFIRNVEEEIAKRYSVDNKMRCPTHLSVGQESVPAVLGSILRHSDKAVSTHRCHAHYLGKGGDLNRMIAEIYGKVTGCSRGLGGSMHLIDKEVGFYGSTAIVGNSIPLSLGLALASKLAKKDDIAITYFGDGAIEEGVFHETLNLAVTKKLPVLFVCENNLYSVYTPLAARQPMDRKIFKLAEAYGVGSYHFKGWEVEKMYGGMREIVNKIRTDSKPAFVEIDVYRWREHCGPNYDNDIGYRTMDEYLNARKNDPVVVFTEQLLSEKVLTLNQLEAIEKEINDKIEKAFQFAEDSDWPSIELMNELVYSKGSV